ncbi:hypothetical protein E3O42_11305 [Cryobacterium adonitolivorans]|uniref:Uncharacterized protein n=1 Tax=Cryobacterium adonitolivorans TaxID=1259189 RepID=A0A4V3ICG1_9MICO|nr:hypothetical protein [Cryobacterium adonitolivorans]TFC01054.1 hypothetical protein E3O42_11305 [Cryobacterium adonitolivorans]
MTIYLDNVCLDVRCADCCTEGDRTISTATVDDRIVAAAAKSGLVAVTSAAGIRVFQVKFISIIASGALCGLAGAQLAMASAPSPPE